MKTLLIALALMISGCAQLMHGQSQPVVIKGDNLMATTCSGSVEDWGSCNKKALKACPNGYNVVEKVESPIGGRRDLTFQCKLSK